MRTGTVIVALCALLAIAVPAPELAAPAPAPAAASAQGKPKPKPKTRAQKLSACLRKANRKRGTARRRARAACRAKYGPKKAAPKQPGTPGVPGVPGTPSVPNVPTPPPPAVDPVRDDAKFRETLKGSLFKRQYAVPKPNHGAGYNYHDEYYAFCDPQMGHEYEGIAYIYKSIGPWEIVEGHVNGDGSKGRGTFRFTQASANFAQEVGKVQTIQIEWDGTRAQIVHPEIGTYEFERAPGLAGC